MAGNFTALAVRLAASKGPVVQKATVRAGQPRSSGSTVDQPPKFYGKPGMNTRNPRGVGIGGLPGYKSVEPRVGRPRVGGRAAPRYAQGYGRV